MARRKGRLESYNVLFAPITTPVGTILDFAGTVPPSGWLMCSGEEVSRTTYNTLFITLNSGAIYGTGNGTTTFNLPDCRGRVSAGKDNMIKDSPFAGTSANRLTGTVSGGINGDNLAAVGGVQDHVLTPAQTPIHDHGGGIHAHTATTTGGTHNGGGTNTGQFADGGNNLQVPTTTVNNSTTIIASFGGDGNHNNVQPTIIFNKIIKT